MKKEKINLIINYLNELFPNPVCELNYNKDYELLIAVVLSAQSTDKAVNKVTEVLFNKYPSLEALDKANLEDIKNIVKPLGLTNTRALNIKDIANKLLLNNNIVPNDFNYLITLKGVGRKVANVVLSELFNYPAIAVDTHVTRVSIRLKLANKNDNVNIIEQKLMKSIPKDIWYRFHLQMVLFGRYYCQARKPLCNNCKLLNVCIEKNKNF